MASVDAVNPWYLYLIECRSGAYYAGITNDLEKRYEAHVAGKGARYTRANPPARLLEYVVLPDRSTASIAEYRIKHLPRAMKMAFLRDLKLSLDAQGGSAAKLVNVPR